MKQGLAFRIDTENPSNQLTGYMTLASVIFNKPVLEGDLNLIEVRAPNKTKATPRTFLRLPTIRSEAQIEAWLNQTEQVMHEINRCVADMKSPDDVRPWRQRTVNCRRKYGLCDYLEVCRAHDCKLMRNSTLFEKWKWLPGEGPDES